MELKIEFSLLFKYLCWRKLGHSISFDFRNFYYLKTSKEGLLVKLMFSNHSGAQWVVVQRPSYCVSEDLDGVIEEWNVFQTDKPKSVIWKYRRVKGVRENEAIKNFGILQILVINMYMSKTYYIIFSSYILQLTLFQTWHHPYHCASCKR